MDFPKGEVYVASYAFSDCGDADPSAQGEALA